MPSASLTLFLDRYRKRSQDSVVRQVAVDEVAQFNLFVEALAKAEAHKGVVGEDERQAEVVLVLLVVPVAAFDGFAFEVLRVVRTAQSAHGYPKCTSEQAQAAGYKASWSGTEVGGEYAEGNHTKDF